MTVTIRRPLSNKPPKKEGLKNVLDASYPTKVGYSDGFESNVSRPILDRIAVIAPLDAAHIDEKFGQSKKKATVSFEDWVRQFMQNLYNDVGSKQKQSKFSGKQNLYTQVVLDIGGEPVLIGLLKADEDGNRRLRFEFCPAKLSAPGVSNLNQSIDTAAAGAWVLSKARAFARITYLEVAADIAFLEPAEIVVWSDKAKITVQYKGADGALETEYGATSATIAGKPRYGKTVYRMYDKSRQLVALGLKPPLGEHPITRVEVCKRWTSNAPLLKALSNSINPFDDVRVSYVRDGQQAALSGWLDFVFLRRFLSESQTRRRLGYDAKLGATLETAFKALPFNAFDKSAWWDDWPTSVKKCGIEHFLAKPNG